MLAFGYNAFAAGMCNFLLGRFGEAEQSVRGFVEVSEDAGLLWGAAWLWSLLSQAQLYQGDFAASLASGLRAEELGRRPGAASVMPMPMVFVAEVLVAQGRLAEAEERLDEARRWQEDRPNKFANAWYFFGLGWLRDAQGRHGEAADAYAEMAARFEARGQQAQIGLKPELAHALIRAGRPDRALVVAREVVATIAGRDMPMGQATASASLAAALSACGHHAEGVTEARRAVELGDGVDGGLFAARARAVLGEALLRAGERVEACDVLRDAHQRLAAFPLVPDRDRVAALLAELGFTSPRPVRPAPADGGPSRAGPLDDLSRRERDVVELAVTGVSSRSIALRLGLSERTVENHLQRTYVKLGVHSRAELIALVAGTASAAAG